MMDFKELLASIEEDRAKRLALPVAERLRLYREEAVEDLVEYGYLSPDEAEQYRKPLSALPSDRKGLIVAYFLKGLYDPNVTDFEDTTSLQNFIRGFRLPERGFGKGDRTIADVLSPEEGKEFRTGYRKLTTASGLRRAEDFIDSKRRRLRDRLLRTMRARVASALSLEPVKEDGETLDSTPYLRDYAVEHGYRPRAKTISASDRQAIESAASYYLDLLELCYLNGQGEERRTEKYPRYLSEDSGKWDETFYYDDEVDEALTEYSDVYGVLEDIVENYYNDSTAKDMIDMVKNFDSRYYTYRDGKPTETDRIEEDLVLGRLLNSKFRYLIDEKLC